MLVTFRTKQRTTNCNSISNSFGEVSSAKVITDRETGQSKGFGFVEMPNDSEANEAVDQTNGLELKGRKLRVNEAQPRPRHSGAGRGGGGGGRRH